MKNAFSFILICLLGSHAIANQKVVSVRTLLLGDGEAPGSWLRVEGESKLVQLVWPKSQPSKPLDVIHEGNLELLHSSRLPRVETGPEASSSVKLPEAAKEVLLLGITDAGEIEYRAIEDIFMEAKFNDWLVINVGDQAVEFKVGDKESVLKIDAGASAIFRPEIIKGPGVKVIAQTDRRGEMRPFFSTYWPAASGQRNIIIFYRDGERMRARRIADRLE